MQVYQFLSIISDKIVWSVKESIKTNKVRVGLKTDSENSFNMIARDNRLFLIKNIHLKHRVSSFLFHSSNIYIRFLKFSLLIQLTFSLETDKHYKCLIEFVPLVYNFKVSIENIYILSIFWLQADCF